MTYDGGAKPMCPRCLVVGADVERLPPRGTLGDWFCWVCTLRFRGTATELAAERAHRDEVDRRRAEHAARVANWSKR